MDMERVCRIVALSGVEGFPDEDPGTGGRPEGGEYLFLCGERPKAARDVDSSKFGDESVPSRIDM
jgi:hypothetical protein